LKNKKRILVPHATYKGVQIIEGGIGFVVFLGTERHEFLTLPETTGFIDGWYKTKEN